MNKRSYIRLLQIIQMTTLAAVVSVLPVFSQTVTTVASFPGGNATEFPGGTPAQGRDGRLYGTSFGTTFGSIFRVTTAGEITEIYALDGTNAINPFTGLTLASDGNFYGTSATGNGTASAGVLFRSTPTGKYSDLHEFEPNSDNMFPKAVPILGSDNNLYGTAFASVYSLTPVGNFSTIHSFGTGEVTGPTDPLIQGADGKLYGTGNAGGSDNCGGVFKLSLSGALLLDFGFNCSKQGAGGGPLVQASDGGYYGLTWIGGVFNLGTVYKVDKTGKVTILHDFQGGPSDGVGGIQGLVQGTDGLLYGVTQQGGANGTGTIFQISTAGAYKVLYSFPPASLPSTTLMQHTNGKFYGFDGTGGTAGYGTLFSLDMGLGPFVTFVRRFARVGQTVQILGQGFTGTKSVTFNGVPATTFTVSKDTYMTAVVPAGATSGAVVVAAPSATLTSNKDFIVIGGASAATKSKPHRSAKAAGRSWPARQPAS